MPATEATDRRTGTEDRVDSRGYALSRFGHAGIARRMDIELG
jgi:hypothetical protein